MRCATAVVLLISELLAAIAQELKLAERQFRRRRLESHFLDVEHTTLGKAVKSVSAPFRVRAGHAPSGRLVHHAEPLPHVPIAAAGLGLRVPIRCPGVIAHLAAGSRMPTAVSASTADVNDAPGDAMGAIQVPVASALVAPSVTVLSELASLPSLGDEVVKWEAFQSKRQELQRISDAGRRLARLASARLQRYDVAGAKEALEAIEKLPLMENVLGPEIWNDPQRRLEFYEAASFGSFVRGYVACNGVLSMFENGVLTPAMPQRVQIGISNVDDEMYLLGTIYASRDLERYAVNRGQALDLHSVRVCLDVVKSLEESLMQFNLRNSDLRRKFDGVKYGVRKLETLAYEVDLALKRNDANRGAVSSALEVDSGLEVPSLTEPRTESAVESPAELMAVDLTLLQGIKGRYDSYDALREQTIRRSRDVQKSAKNAVYAIQRNDIKRADKVLEETSRAAGTIFTNLVSKSPSLRAGTFSNSIEELVEAVAYRAFRTDNALLSRAALQEASGLEFALTLQEYLGGIMDLTGEIGRLAVRSASRQANDDVERALACVDAVHTGLQDFTYLPSGLAKKMSQLQFTLMKVEGIRYEMALISHGGISVKAPGPAAFDEDASADDWDGDGGEAASERRLRADARPEEVLQDREQSTSIVHGLGMLTAVASLMLGVAGLPRFQTDVASAGSTWPRRPEIKSHSCWELRAAVANCL